MLVRFKTLPSIFDEVETLINSNLIPVPTYDRMNRTDRFAGITMKESGDKIEVAIQLPGVKKEDVKVHLQDAILTVTAERKQPELQENEQWIRNEIAYGKVERTVDLPYSVNAEKVTATHENGILAIVLPKHESAQPKQISIR